VKRTVLTIVVVTLAAAGLLLAARSGGLRSALAGWPHGRAGQPVAIGGERWRPVLCWEAASGPAPGAWSWGEWTLADGALEGRATGDDGAVWFLPCRHRGEFLLETEFLLFPSGNVEAPAEAHLITRESRRLHDETGVSLLVDEPRFYLRHRTGGVDRYAEFSDLAAPVRSDTWHSLQLSVRGGRLTVRLDGRALKIVDGLAGAPVYREPHLAVLRGKARFRNLRIYEPG